MSNDTSAGGSKRKRPTLQKRWVRFLGRITRRLWPEHPNESDIRTDGGQEVIVIDGHGPAVTVTLAVAISTVLAAIVFWVAVAP